MLVAFDHGEEEPDLVHDELLPASLPALLDELLNLRVLPSLSLPGTEKILGAPSKQEARSATGDLGAVAVAPCWASRRTGAPPAALRRASGHSTRSSDCPRRS